MSANLSLHYWSLADLQAAYLSKTVTPVQAVEACLGRIERIDSRLHAFIRVNADQAHASALRLQHSRDDGSVAGLRAVPYALKDNFDVAGLPTTCHSRPRAEDVAGRDSAVSAALGAADAILLGKNSMHELATGGPSFDLEWPPARNPWDLTRHPGGSSSGSAAAVAAGMAYFSLGTDTGGSVRHPATACGIYGFKPGFSVISTDGIVPLAKSLDHAGVLTRSAFDIASVMAVVAESGEVRANYSSMMGRGPSRSLRDCTVGIIDAFAYGLGGDPEIESAFQTMLSELERAGCRTRRISVDSLDHYTACARTMSSAEAYAYHGALIEAQPDAFGLRTRTRVGRGKGVTTEQYIRMRDLQRELTWQLNRAHADVDVAISLSSLFFPCKIDDVSEVERTYDMQARTPFNLTGLPAIAVPCGRASHGLPLGVQFSAAAGRDLQLLDFVLALEREGLCGFTPPPELVA